MWKLSRTSSFLVKNWRDEIHPCGFRFASRLNFSQWQDKLPRTAIRDFCNAKLDVCLSVHICICVQKKNKLNITECFIALMICSTCFGHFYAHHQQLETICVLLPPVVCSVWLLVVGGQVQSSRLCVQPAPDPRQPATKHCTPQAVITHI